MKRVIGNIAGVHGIKGELKIYPLFDSIDDLAGLKEIFIEEKIYKIESMRMHKDFLLVKLKEINDRTLAENTKGSVSADIEIELDPNEYLIEDLIGLKALDQDHSELGIVENFSNLAQKLLFIKLKDSFRAKRELIVPFVEDYIMEINCDEGFIKIKLEEDLLNLAL